MEKKYEPEFQKAKQQAESRLAKEKAKKEAERNTPEAIAKRKATGKKVAIAALATIGTAGMAAITESVIRKQYGVSTIEAVNMALAAARL